MRCVYNGDKYHNGFQSSNNVYMYLKQWTLKVIDCYFSIKVTSKRVLTATQIHQ